MILFYTLFSSDYKGHVIIIFFLWAGSNAISLFIGFKGHFIIKLWVFEEKKNSLDQKKSIKIVRDYVKMVLIDHMVTCRPKWELVGQLTCHFSLFLRSNILVSLTVLVNSV